MVLFLGVCRALKAMHQHRVGSSTTRSGAQSSRKKAKRVRGEAADADREAEAEASRIQANTSRQRREADNINDDDDIEAEPLMDSTPTAALEGVPEGDIRAYAHRDIKPANIMIADSGHQPILMDLGSLAPSPIEITSRARALEVQDQAAEPCTMPYRAPELVDVKTDTVIDTAVDIWSLGCTLYACLVGKSPFEARSEETGGSLSLCVLGGVWRFPDEGPAEARRGKQRVTSDAEVAARKQGEHVISEAVKEVVRACLKVEPAERPDVDGLIDMVEDVVARLPDEGDGGEGS